MQATLVFPDVATTAARAGDFFSAWTADAELPDVAGSTVDALCVLAVRAALYAETGDERAAAALAAPVAVELSALMLDSSFPELEAVLARSGASVIHGAQGARWEPGGYLHRVYAEAFGEPSGRSWPL